MTIYMSTVRIIIIGSEILSGKFVDENTPWLIQKCKHHHLEITGVSIIPDDVETIAHHVRKASQEATYVITTGGVGPTHDDMTMKAIAHAFDCDLVESPELASLIKKHINSSESALRMALVPQNYVLWDCGEKMFPQVVVDNVFIFPGVPSYLQKKFSVVVEKWKGREKYYEQVALLTYESPIAKDLEEIQNEFPGVDIGSYPRLEETPHHTIITVDGYNASMVQQVKELITDRFAEFLINTSK